MNNLKPIIKLLKQSSAAPFNIPLAEDLLLKVTKALDKNNIPYHLEGGTLLGIVRDNAILPWDDDLDISIPAGYEKQTVKALRFLYWEGWRIDKRKYYQFSSVTHTGMRVIKIRDRSRGLLNMGHSYLDIFVKFNQGGNTYWQAKSKLMKVDDHYYKGFDEIDFKGHKLKAPKNYQSYLSEKYGDWKTPVKEWDCSTDEKTIVE
ncbi:MAG: LicD family protein [Gammaproteobacteria bacterium]|nr:LicD family protein [Gammaproteobacteria bacterium]